MRKNVTISMWWNHGEADENAFPDAPELGKNPHAEAAMRHMGITYKTAEPSSMTDSWKFFDCENIPDGPHPKWMKVWEGGMTSKEFHAEAMERVKTQPAPAGQKFPVASRVRVNLNHGRTAMATVKHTYAHAFGGSDVKSYCLNIDGQGSSAWHDEAVMTAAPTEGEA